MAGSVRRLSRKIFIQGIPGHSLNIVIMLSDLPDHLT